MPRGRKVPKRKIQPDLLYKSVLLAKFINRVMKHGKKSVAQKIVYSALSRIEKEQRLDPLEVFQKALASVTPGQEVKARRVGGATYQVPMPVKKERGEALAMRWLIDASRKKKGQPMAKDLVEELLLAVKGEGEAIKKKVDTQKMADANRAFAHFRW